MEPQLPTTGPVSVLPAMSPSGQSSRSLPNAGSPSRPIPRVDRLHTNGLTGPNGKPLQYKILYVAEYIDAAETLVVFKQVDGVLIFIRNLESWYGIYRELE